ncbi:MAG: SRPBCC family protein [Planctomycetota bacterium]
MDFSNPLGIEYRVVGEAEHRGEPVRIVSGGRVFETDIEDLWDALTNAERIPRWFLPISGDLKTGGTYQLEGNAGGHIERCDPPDAFEVTWECGGTASWVRVSLVPEAGGTKLTLEHIMKKDEASEEHWAKYGPGATGVGWDLGFVGLDLHLRTGEPIDQAESHQWMVTDAGKDFIRKSAKAWESAHIASGEEVTTASQMAELTAKAYTGEL